MLQQYLDQLIQELSLRASVSLDEQKFYHLTMGEISVAFKDLEPGVYLFSKICPIPPQKKEELFLYLMKANFLGQGAGGSTLGLLEDESFLTLSLSMPYELSYRPFKETLEDFVNFVDYWRLEVEKHKLESEKSSE